MRLIDADALICSECGSCDGYCDCCDGVVCLQCISHNKCQLREAIDNAPTIDAEPVVRCKECKHRGTEACPMCFDFDEYDEDCGYEYRVIDRTEDDGHCHKGEKEEER